MAEFKFKNNGISLTLEGFRLNVFPEVAEKTLSTIAELLSGASEITGEEEKSALCGNITLELNRMFNADRIIQRIFENANREMNLYDICDIVSYITAEVESFENDRQTLTILN